MCCAPGPVAAPTARLHRGLVCSAQALAARVRRRHLDQGPHRGTRRGPHLIGSPTTARRGRGGLSVGRGITGGWAAQIRRRQEGRRHPRRGRRHRVQRAGPGRIRTGCWAAPHLSPRPSPMSGLTRATPAQQSPTPQSRPQSSPRSRPDRNPATGSSSSHAVGRSNAPTAGSTAADVSTGITKSPSRRMKDSSSSAKLPYYSDDSTATSCSTPVSGAASIRRAKLCRRAASAVRDRNPLRPTSA
jgi:hypothetical protein